MRSALFWVLSNTVPGIGNLKAYRVLAFFQAGVAVSQVLCASEFSCSDLVVVLRLEQF